MTAIERIKAGLESDTPGRVEWRSLLETALFEIERLRDDLAASERLRDRATKELGKDSALVERLRAALREIAGCYMVHGHRLIGLRADVAILEPRDIAERALEQGTRE